MPAFQRDPGCCGILPESFACLLAQIFEQIFSLGTKRPGVLQSTGSQRVRHDCVTEQQASTIKQ